MVAGWIYKQPKQKILFKNDLHKISWKEHCSNPDPNVALEHFLQIIHKFLDKHAPYVMSESCSFFTSKPWISTAIANSIKSKKQDLQKLYRKKNHNKGKFMESQREQQREI